MSISDWRVCGLKTPKHVSRRGNVGALQGVWHHPQNWLQDLATGFSPLQALQAATLNPARFLGREKDLGTVEKGKVADLVLLDANPLDNIANTNASAP